MGLFSRIKRRLRHSGTKADNYRELLVWAKGYIDTYRQVEAHKLSFADHWLAELAMAVQRQYAVNGLIPPDIEASKDPSNKPPNATRAGE